jgi:hypothetical protein
VKVTSVFNNICCQARSHGSMSVNLKKLSVTIVFDSDELIRLPNDDPQGSKHVVIIKTT